LTMYANWAKNI